MDPTQILTAVSSFYDQAFNKLLAATFGLIAFIGVIVPLLVGWFQLRTLRAEKSSLLAELRLEISNEREEMRAQIDTGVQEQVSKLRVEFENRFDELSKKIERSSAMAIARTHHLQGTVFNNREKYHLAVGDFCHAASMYIKANDEANAQRCLRLLTETCLPKTTSSNLEKFKGDESCKELIKDLDRNNENGRYTNHIGRIERELQRSRERALKNPSAEADA